MSSRQRGVSLPKFSGSNDDLDSCRRCELWKAATQAIAGEGPVDAALMLVGEQPGEQEDRVGRPFVGPAGRVLDELLEAAGLERDKIFVTNAVKHFKWQARGKRRLHVRPNAGEIHACNIWLAQEIASLRPAVIIALGATATRALIRGRGSIGTLCGCTLRHPLGAKVFVTYHPSAVLRADEKAQRVREALLEDLKRVRRELSSAEVN